MNARDLNSGPRDCALSSPATSLTPCLIFTNHVFVGKSACWPCLAWLPEANPWNLCKGGRRELMPQSCFLTSPSHHARPYTLTNNRNIKKACSNLLIRMLSECILENMYFPACASQDQIPGRRINMKYVLVLVI